MKRFLVLLAVLALGASASFAATTNTITNAYGIVVTSVTDQYGTHVISAVPANNGSSAGVTAAPNSSTSIALADGKILVGDAYGRSAAQTPSGDLTMTRAGVVTLADNAAGAAEVGPGRLPNDVLLPASITWTNTMAVVIDGTTAHSGTITILNGAGTGTNIVLTVVDGLIKAKTP